MEENENIKFMPFLDIPAEMPGVSSLDDESGEAYNDNDTYDDNKEATGARQNYKMIEDEHQKIDSASEDVGYV